jgi:hypothetical protein
VSETAVISNLDETKPAKASAETALRNSSPFFSPRIVALTPMAAVLAGPPNAWWLASKMSKGTVEAIRMGGRLDENLWG